MVVVKTSDVLICVALQRLNQEPVEAMIFGFPPRLQGLKLSNPPNTSTPPTKAATLTSDS